MALQFFVSIWKLNLKPIIKPDELSQANDAENPLMNIKEYESLCKV